MLRRLPRTPILIYHPDRAEKAKRDGQQIIIHNAKGVLHEASVNDEGHIFLEKRREDIEAYNVPKGSIGDTH
jgi:hypothetical protein